VRTLADLAPRRHRDLLFAALDDPSPLVSMIGARTLVKMGSAEAVDAVLDRLHRYAAWSDNYLASMFVSAGSAALEPLRKRLASGELPDRSTAVALRTLRLLGDPTAVSPALAALGENASVSTRVAALGVLAKLGSGEHAAAARQAARAPEDAVRSHALSALGRLGGGADVPLLLEGLRNSSPWVARHAADGLVHLGAFDELARFAESGHENALHARQALAEEAA
jgi:HEAT repeat protein